MNVFALTGLSVALSCLILSAITFFFGKTKLHRLLLFFNIVVSLWGLGVFLVGIANNETEAVFAWKVANLGSWLIAPTFFYMMSIFCGTKHPKLITFAYAQAIFFIVTSLFTKHVINDMRFAFDLYYNEASLFYIISIIFYVFFAILGFFELIIFLKKTSGHKRTQTLYNIFGFLFGFIGGTTTLLPMIHFDVFVPFGNFGITIYVFILAYAILRHNLMDIHLVFRRTVTYSLSAGLITSLFVIIVLAITKLFSTYVEVDSFSVTVIAALIIAFVFHPVRTKVESLIDKFFAKSKYNYSLIMKNVTDKLAVMINPDEVRKFILDTIFSSLQLQYASILNHEKGGFNLVYSRTQQEDSTKKTENASYSIPGNSALISLLKERKRVTERGGLPNSIEEHRLTEIEKTLQPVGGEIIVPIFLNKDLIDILILGGKVSGDSFSSEDINLLQSISDYTTVSLKNVDLYADLESQIGQTIKEMEERKKIELEKKKLESWLHHSQKLEAVGRLAGGVAHDFNNILFVILGYTDLVLEQVPADSELAENIGIIKESGEKATILTRQLLAFSRKQVLEMKVVKLNSLIEDMAKILGRMIGEDIELDYKFNNSTRGVLADPSQIEQVLMNFAINARDAMPKGGHLTIETKDVEFGAHNIDYNKEIKPGPYTLISVSDTGSGMSEDIQRKIFEPFFTTKEKGKGTGLGLATVYGIIKQHNGYIYVYSEPDKGTTFKIYLPVMLDGELAQGEIVADTQIPKGTETILVVEDESSLRKYIIDVLRPLGYKIFGAADSEEALKISADYEEDIHLLLTDFIMPGINGRELADTLQKDRPDMKVLIMSGYTDDVIAQHGVLEDGINFIQKPVTVTKMASKIRSVLAGE